MICSCPCGQSDLVDGESLGIWTLADVVCEYRECLICHSVRPYMHPNVVADKLVTCYHDPLATSPILGPSENGFEPNVWASIVDALVEAPPADVAELRRGGVVLARAFCAVDGVLGWRVLPPT
jgi:hypothetical protein